jgi:hypothetical protein
LEETLGVGDDEVMAAGGDSVQKLVSVRELQSHHFFHGARRLGLNLQRRENCSCRQQQVKLNR